MNQNPEQLARDKIDKMLVNARWLVQSKDKLLEFSGGKNLKQITKELTAAYDPDEIDARAQIEIDKVPVQNQTPALIEKTKKTAQEELIRQAASTFNGELNEYLKNVRREHEQLY